MASGLFKTLAVFRSKRATTEKDEEEKEYSIGLELVH